MLSVGTDRRGSQICGQRAQKRECGNNRGTWQQYLITRSTGSAGSVFRNLIDRIAVAAHVPDDRAKQYRRCHEAARVFGISGAWHFVFARQALGLHYIRRAGPTLFSRKCRLPIKSAPLRTHPQHTTSGLLVGQLRAYCTVRLVLLNDKRTVSHVAVVGVCLGRRGLYWNGDTGGSSGGHQRVGTLPLARSNSRHRWYCAWVGHCLSLDYDAQKAASSLDRSQQLVGPERERVSQDEWGDEAWMRSRRSILTLCG